MKRRGFYSFVQFAPWRKEADLVHAFSITQTSRNRCASHRLHLCRVMARPAQCVLMQEDNPPAPLRPRHTLNIRCFRIAKCMRNNCTIRATTKPEIPQRQTARNSTQSSQVTSTSPSSRLLVSYSSRGSTRGERVGGWCDSLTPWASRACASRSCDGLSLTPRRFGGASWRQAPGHP